VKRVRYRWRDEYDSDPQYQRILAAMEQPWWKRPAALWGGVVAVAVASFFLGGAVLGSDSGSGTPSQDSWVQDQVNERSQNNQPVGVSAAQKSQILSRYCNQQAGGPYNVSEAAYLECLQSYEVTDQGMVMPR
jgi:1,6-anhydro-N-acetylmuramate kinase